MPRPRGGPRPAAGAVLLLAALGCAGPGAPSAPGGGPEVSPPTVPGTRGAWTATGLLPPGRLAEGDRWFVALRPAEGDRPFAERHRRVRGVDGVLREEVTWGPSFEAVAAARHGVLQTYALLLDDRGLQVDSLDPDGRPRGMPAVEVGAPFEVGTAWTATRSRARDLVGTIVAVETAETPGGTTPRTLRVEVRSRNPHRPSLTTWYDAGLRPVRCEIRDGEGRLLETRAALPDGAPSPAASAAALAWARDHLPR